MPHPTGTEWNTLAVRYGLRQFMTTLLEWNPAVAQKWLQVGERALSLSMASQKAAPDDGLWAYVGEAQQASPWHQALRQTVDEAAKLVDSKVDPSSARLNQVDAAAACHSIVARPGGRVRGMPFPPETANSYRSYFP